MSLQFREQLRLTQLFSIFVGSFGGLKQRRLKTLLAYSSTSHMGYALIAFGTATFTGVRQEIE